MVFATCIICFNRVTLLSSQNIDCLESLNKTDFCVRFLLGSALLGSTTFTAASNGSEVHNETREEGPSQKEVSLNNETKTRETGGGGEFLPYVNLVHQFLNKT